MIVQVDSEKFQREIDCTKEINRRCDNEAWNAGLEQAEEIFRKSVDLLCAIETYVYCGGLKNPFGDKDETMFPVEHLVRIEKADFGCNRELLIYSEKLPDCDVAKYHLTYLGKRTSISL